MVFRKMNRLAIIVFISAGLIVLLIGLFYLAFQTPVDEESDTRDFQSRAAGVFANSSPTPTPFLFEEITIPHLRKRSYESELAELSKLSENSSYTSYLTSYNSDGLKVNGYLTIPKSEMPEDGYPAIVFIHGYIPPSVYNTTDNYVSFLDYLAREGFVVFKIDLRGHDESEGEPGGAYFSGDYIVDTLNAYSSLQNADFVNSEKVGLWGHSMGGNVVFRSMVAKKDIPATVIWAGAVYTYSDMQEYGIQDNSYRPPDEDSERQRKRELLRNTYGDFDPDDLFWKQVPGTNYLEEVTGAIQLNHAEDDSVVNIGYSRNLMQVLNGSGMVHELKTYPTGGHNLVGTTHTEAWQNTVFFFNKYLKP